MKTIFIYPCEFGNINKVDVDYETEKMIADKNGIQNIMFNYDAYMTMGEKLKISDTNISIEENTIAVYRGWMMKPEQYTKFYNDLLNLYNIKLINTPYEYESTHCFNIAYDRLQDYTPKIAVFSEDEVKYIEWDEVKQYFKRRFIIKDYVKSVKGFDFPAYLDYTYTTEQLDELVSKFIELRGDLYTGGIILKEYVELDNNGGKTHEFRAFYYKGRLINLYHNSNNHEDKKEEAIKFAQSIPRLNSNFYTVDFALTKSGNIIVLECGDGQVSGIESSVDDIECIYNRFI